MTDDQNNDYRRQAEPKGPSVSVSLRYYSDEERLRVIRHRGVLACTPSDFAWLIACTEVHIDRKRGIEAAKR